MTQRNSHAVRHRLAMPDLSDYIDMLVTHDASGEKVPLPRLLKENGDRFVGREVHESIRTYAALAMSQAVLGNCPQAAIPEQVMATYRTRMESGLKMIDGLRQHQGAPVPRPQLGPRMDTLTQEEAVPPNRRTAGEHWVDFREALLGSIAAYAREGARVQKAMATGRMR